MYINLAIDSLIKAKCTPFHTNILGNINEVLIRDAIREIQEYPSKKVNVSLSHDWQDVSDIVLDVFRIATLVLDGWSCPIEIDTDASFKNIKLIDGNHRVAACIIKEQPLIYTKIRKVHEPT